MFYLFTQWVGSSTIVDIETNRENAIERCKSALRTGARKVAIEDKDGNVEIFESAEECE